MAGQQREQERVRTGMLAVAARWFRSRTRGRGDLGDGDHAHWDPVNRTWRFHTHRSTGSRPPR